MARLIWIVIFLVLLTDQALKIWVKTHMSLGDQIPIFGHWFSLYFTENNGIAFGIQMGESIGKFLLSLFRILLVFCIIAYTIYMVRRGRVRKATGVALALIIGGALGNIIDGTFYGQIFSTSEPIFSQGRIVYPVAQLFPEGGGYAPLFYGKVVDMFSVHLFSFTWPEWMPWIGGSTFSFFGPIFNIADSAISVGVVVLLIVNRKFFFSSKKR